jgi:hypothetical protein
MNDFFGQPLAIGDEVAFMKPKYRNMVVGKIVSFAPQSMLIQWHNRFFNAPDTFRATSWQVIKKPKIV